MDICILMKQNLKGMYQNEPTSIYKQLLQFKGQIEYTVFQVWCSFFFFMTFLHGILEFTVLTFSHPKCVELRRSSGSTPSILSRFLIGASHPICVFQRSCCLAVLCQNKLRKCNLKGSTQKKRLPGCYLLVISHSTELRLAISVDC